MGAQVQSGIRRVLFQPPEASYTPDAVATRSGFVTLENKFGDSFTAWTFSPGRSSSTAPDHHEDDVFDEDRVTLLFSHANAEDLGLCLHFLHDVGRYLKVNVLAYDYCGYGVSTGSPCEQNLYANAEAAYTYLRDGLGVPWQRILVYGRSIGTGPTTYLAANAPVRGVVLQAPMASIFRILFDLRFTLPGDQFANTDRIGRVEAPVCIVHGTNDEIVPVWHGVQLFQKLRRPVEPLWVAGGDHNDLDTAAVLRRVRGFLSELGTMGVSDGQLAQAEKWDRERFGDGGGGEREADPRRVVQTGGRGPTGFSPRSGTRGGAPLQLLRGDHAIEIRSPDTTPSSAASLRGGRP